MKYSLALALLLNQITAKDLNVGVFSDIHLALNYDPSASKCRGSFRDEEKFLDLKKDQKALLGKMGCDPPKELVDYML